MLRTSLAAGALLVAIPAAAAASSAVEGGKGSDVITPINDTREDILAAAGDAEGVATRAKTILGIGNADRPVVTLPPASPISSVPVTGPADLASVPAVFANDEGSLPLAYLAAGGLLIPLLLGSGGGGDGNPLPPGFSTTPPGSIPSGPVAGPPPTDVPIVPESVVPEPATWMMLLLGFGAMGLAIRHSRAKGAAAERCGQALAP